MPDSPLDRALDAIIESYLMTYDRYSEQEVFVVLNALHDWEDA